jgi:replicative DNA helicase
MSEGFMKKSRGSVEDSIADLPAICALESERVVLGAMLTESNLIEEVAMILVETDFFNPAHQILFREVVMMRAEGHPIDPGTVLQWLEDRELAGQCGGAPLLGELAAGISSVLTWAFHADIVRKKALMRLLKKKAVEIVYAVHEHQDDPTAVLNAAEVSIAGVVDRAQGGLSSSKSTVRGMREVVRDFLKETGELVGKKNQFSGIPTGFYQLDLLLGGFQPGEYVVIVAPPGLGKTAFMQNLVLNMAASKKCRETGSRLTPGHSVGIFSAEMTHDQLMKRMISQTAKMRSGHVRTPQNWSGRDLDLVCLAADDLALLPVVIDADGFLTPQKFMSRARWMVRQHKVEVLFLDYLQLMVLDEKVVGDVETETTRRASHAIRQTAKALGIPIIVLAQFNKEGLRSGRPTMESIKGSGQIIQDAHCILIMSEEERESGYEDGPACIKITVAKSRESERGVYRMFDYKGDVYTFKEQQSARTSGHETYR